MTWRKTTNNNGKRKEGDTRLSVLETFVFIAQILWPCVREIPRLRYPADLFSRRLTPTESQRPKRRRAHDKSGAREYAQVRRGKI